MQIVKMLASKSIPVTVSVPSIIPGLNDEGIFTLVKVAAEHGAKNIQAQVVGLNSEVTDLFKTWARKSFPYRWRKMIAL